MLSLPGTPSVTAALSYAAVALLRKFQPRAVATERGIAPSRLKVSARLSGHVQSARLAMTGAPATHNLALALDVRA